MSNFPLLTKIDSSASGTDPVLIFIVMSLMTIVFLCMGYFGYRHKIDGDRLLGFSLALITFAPTCLLGINLWIL